MGLSAINFESRRTVLGAGGLALAGGLISIRPRSETRNENLDLGMQVKQGVNAARRASNQVKELVEQPPHLRREFFRAIFQAARKLA